MPRVSGTVYGVEGLTRSIVKKSWCKDFAHNFLHTIDLDIVLEAKLVVAW
jgi:hypothetical protein